MARQDPGQISRELAEQLRNGNRGRVSARLAELTPEMAASVAFYLRDQLSDAYTIGVMGRLLERKALESQEDNG